MTATTERLDAITARSQGLTDLCAEHLRQSIRHVQRNCDIDCNIHEDETTWGECKQPDRGDGDRMAAVLADVPYLLDLARKQAAALEAVTARLDEWAAMKPFPDAEETQVWYSAGKRHASEAVRAIIAALEATL
jgi:hypothetical protein